METKDILQKLGPNSFDLLFDCVGASNYELTRMLLGLDSHWVIYGFLGGSLVD